MKRRLFNLATVLPLLLCVCWASAAKLDTVDALLDIVADSARIPFAQREAAKDELILRPYDEVLPKLAPRIPDPPNFPEGFGIGNPVPLDPERAPTRELARVALESVWYTQMRKASPEDLVRYLEAPIFVKLRDRLVVEIWNHWSPEAQGPLIKILQTAGEVPFVRFCAAKALLINRFDECYDKVLDFIEADLRSERSFSTDLINDLLSRAPRAKPKAAMPDARILVIARECVERDVRKYGRTSAGYHTAMAMGSFIADRSDHPMPNAFGLRYSDTVPRELGQEPSDALSAFPVLKMREWWTANGEHLRAASTRPLER